MCDQQQDDKGTRKHADLLMLKPPATIPRTMPCGPSVANLADRFKKQRKTRIGTP